MGNRGAKAVQVKILGILAIAAIPLLMVAACGGSGGGGDGGTTAGSVRSLGEITAKGSVTVNGVTFNTDSADIVMDGQPASDDDLRVGMAVEVAGEINADGTTGTATTVTFDDTIQGAVAGKNADGSFTVMGQPVFTDQGTRIDDSIGGVKTFDDVAGVVEVSGQVDDQGRIIATHIELKPAGAESEITGVVDSITPLTVAGIPVITSETLTLGALVEVKGSFDGTSLTATSIELNPGLGDDDNFHFEGFVISGDAGAFTINGHHLDQQLNVTTTNSTLFEGGNRTDLIVGTKVEVDGVLTGNNLAATKVQFRENVRIEMVAGAASADLSNLALLNLSAVSVSLNALTRTDDNSTVTGIGVNDSVEIRGRLAADGSIIATRLRVDDPPSSNLDRVILRGPVESISGSTIVLLGVSVNTGSVGIEFRPNDDNSNDDNAQSISQAAFLAQVTPGTVIKVRGVLTADNQLTADEMELED
jgi:hypothetical protein